MPVPTNHRKNRSRNRRNEVLDAARDLFFVNGYHGTTIEKIATRTGYSKWTVYLDFPNKDGERLFEKLEIARAQKAAAGGER